jgi:hypothetical protein
MSLLRKDRKILILHAHVGADILACSALFINITETDSSNKWR